MRERVLKKLNIKSLDHLVLLLGCSQGRLLNICNNISKYYRSGDRFIKGKNRHIDEPISYLRKIINRLQLILRRVELPSYLHGGRENYSIITNAKEHIGQAAVMNFDIQDFFPSIHYPRVYKMFLGLGCSHDVARILTRLTTYNGCVPHGSPTSTTVANLCIVPLAKRIKSLAELHYCRYTQFIDDGVLSGRAYIGKLRRLIDKILRQERFCASPKEHKKQTQYRNQEQTVTGVKVNYQIDIPEKKYASIRKEIIALKIAVQNGKRPSGKELKSVQGKINHVKLLRRSKGDRLQRIFNKSLSEVLLASLC